jgi:hypothetical protein
LEKQTVVKPAVYFQAFHSLLVHNFFATSDDTNLHTALATYKPWLMRERMGMIPELES